MIKAPTRQEEVLNKLAERRKRNGTPTYVMPDMYEIMMCREAGIDIDYSPMDAGNDPPEPRVYDEPISK